MLAGSAARFLATGQALTDGDLYQASALAALARDPPIWSGEPFAAVSDGCAQIRSFWSSSTGSSGERLCGPPANIP
jgi:hypothetical protein